LHGASRDSCIALRCVRPGREQKPNLIWTCTGFHVGFDPRNKRYPCAHSTLVTGPIGSTSSHTPKKEIPFFAFGAFAFLFFFALERAFI
jgi:hypothetical protein